MIRNSFSLSAICGGAANSTSKISTEGAFLLELKNNPVLSEALFTLMDNPEVLKIFGNPATLQEFGNLVNRLDPKFVASLPKIVDKYKMIYGSGL